MCEIAKVDGAADQPPINIVKAGCPEEIAAACPRKFLLSRVATMGLPNSAPAVTGGNQLPITRTVSPAVPSMPHKCSRDGHTAGGCSKHGDRTLVAPAS
jgi:hypothetical protein